MPFINSKVTVKMTDDKKETIKKKFGEAIKLIPGKSENWLMVGFEDGYDLYFREIKMVKVHLLKLRYLVQQAAVYIMR